MIVRNFDDFEVFIFEDLDEFGVFIFDDFGVLNFSDLESLILMTWESWTWET